VPFPVFRWRGSWSFQAKVNTRVPRYARDDNRAKTIEGFARRWASAVSCVGLAAVGISAGSHARSKARATSKATDRSVRPTRAKATSKAADRSGRPTQARPRPAGDPSLRLKNGCARDDADGWRRESQRQRTRASALHGQTQNATDCGAGVGIPSAWPGAGFRLRMTSTSWRHASLRITARRQRRRTGVFVPHGLASGAEARGPFFFDMRHA